MRFLMFIKGNADSEAGVMPSKELVEAMMRYNEEMAKAGILVDLNGLHAANEGAKVRFSKGTSTVLKGPFTDTKDVVAGYWILKTNSLQEAIDWAKKVPSDPHNPNAEGEIEIRQIFEMDEMGMPEATENARKIEQELIKNR